MSYSVDLRKRVLKYVEENNNMFEASIVFDINYNTVRNWYKAYTEENRLEPKEAYRQEPYKLNWEELRAFVEDNPDLEQQEYAAHFGVSRGQIGKVLKKLGITRKKKALPITNKMRKKSQNFMKSLRE
jgi:putative transposase